jgi:hypothetical protein
MRTEVDSELLRYSNRTLERRIAGSGGDPERSGRKSTALRHELSKTTSADIALADEHEPSHRSEVDALIRPQTTP